MDPNPAPQTPTEQPVVAPPTPVENPAADPMEPVAPVTPVTPPPAEPAAPGAEFGPAIVAAPEQPVPDAGVSDTSAQLPAADASLVEENPEKHYLTALIFSWLLGGLGVDRFYLKRVGSGILKLVTLGGFGVWSIIDFVLIALGKLTVKDDPRPLMGYGRQHRLGKMLIVIMILVTVLLVVGLGLLLVAGMRDDSFVNQYR